MSTNDKHNKIKFSHFSKPADIDSLDRAIDDAINRAAVAGVKIAPSDIDDLFKRMGVTPDSNQDVVNAVFSNPAFEELFTPSIKKYLSRGVRPAPVRISFDESTPVFLDSIVSEVMREYFQNTKSMPELPTNVIDALSLVDAETENALNAATGFYFYGSQRKRKELFTALIKTAALAIRCAAHVEDFKPKRENQS